jgi:hypothetical protein
MAEEFGDSGIFKKLTWASVFKMMLYVHKIV